MKRFSFLVLIILMASCQNKKKAKEENSNNINKSPNIVYILADDMGYGDISALNPKSGIQTPNMDNIIKNGKYFTDAHSNSAVCTPTRYGILTGRYAWRSRLKDGVLWGYDPPLIEKERTTVASFLGENGYATACIGKWHLGLDWQSKNPELPIKRIQWNEVIPKGEDSNVDFSKKASGPNAIGFDYSYIIPASLDMAPYVYLENDKPTALPLAYTEGKSEDKDGRGVIWRAGEMDESFDFYNVLDNFTNKATNYIEEQSKNESPFFLYFPLTAPHTPWLPPDAVNGKSNAGKYGDFVSMVDDVVGRVVATLEKTGQLENTLIIITSDNGSHWKPEDKEQFTHRANHIYKGQKADIYEAGHRVPYIAKWKGVIPAGSHSDQVICTTDLLATMAGILNKPLPNNAGEDSYNLWPAYISNVNKPIREATIHHSLQGAFAIRKGKWKYTAHLGSGGFSTPKTIEPNEGDAPATLFDVENDPKEENNLYNENPEIVEELTLLLEKYKKQGYSRKLSE